MALCWAWWKGSQRGLENHSTPAPTHARTHSASSLASDIQFLPQPRQTMTFVYLFSLPRQLRSCTTKTRVKDLEVPVGPTVPSQVAHTDSSSSL